MGQLVSITKLADFNNFIGQDIFVSDWTLITQEAVNLFADATGDHQWIHVDPVRAKQGPFGGTIAHGFMTLSMIAGWGDKGAFQLPDVRMGINYGLNKVRFMHPVLVGSKLRGVFKMSSYEEIEGGAQIVMVVTVEIEGKDKPACVAETVSRRYR